MSNLAEYQFPPPKNWQSFESLCLDIWKKIWNDPNAKKNGRSGQKQHGTDVYGYQNQGHLLNGVQCKGKDNYSNKKVTIKELEKEVEKAKKFKPSLSTWILVTTAPSDAQLQEKAREINEKHLEQGLFRVDVWSWEDIQEEIANHHDIVRKHFSYLNIPDQTLSQEISSVNENFEKASSDVKDQVGTLNENFANLNDKFGVMQSSLPQGELHSEFNAEIDYAVKLLKDNQNKQCIDYLKELKNRIWLKAPDNVKFRLLTNLGNAYYNLSDINEAGAVFLEAYQYNPDDEVSLINKALAYHAQSDFEKVQDCIQQVLDKNPANLNAYAILLQIPPCDDSLEESLKLVPDYLYEKPVIAFTLGLSAQSEENFEEALRWFEIAVENEKKEIRTAKPYLAVMLMKNLWSYSSPLLIGQVSDEDKKVLERVIKLLDDSWNQVKDTELAKVYYVWLLNRGIAKRTLGQIDEAYEDIKTAYKLNKDDAETAKHLALTAIKKQLVIEAIEALEKHTSNKDVPEINIFLADLYFQKKEPQNALEVLEKFIEWNTVKNLALMSYRLLVRFHITNTNLEKAEILSEKLLNEFPQEISSYISASQLASAKNNPEDSVSLLLQAKSFDLPKKMVSDINDLAHEFMKIGLFKEASECLKVFTDTAKKSEHTLNLLVCYYNAGLLGKALEVCKKVRDSFGILPRYTEIEIGILEEINDLRRCKKLAKKYLKKYPDYFPVQLRIARIGFLLGDYEKLDKFLNQSFDVETVALQDGLTVSSLLAKRGKLKESFDLMYELRRINFDKADAHFFYIGNFFTNDKDNEKWLKATTANLNTAVCLKHVNGEIEWFIIESRIAPDLQRREFSIEHATVQNFFGKSVGDRIAIKESSNNEEYATIVEIKNKYVYALHETCSRYETMFPDRNDFWSMNIRKVKEEADDDEINIDKLRKILKERSTFVNKVFDLYQNSLLTVGFVAEQLGLSAYEGWLGLLTNNKYQTFSTTGNPQTLKRAISILTKEKPPKLATDITSIHLAHYLKVEDKIVECFGKLLVAPTTLFSLYRYIEDLEKHRKTGRLSLVEQNGILFNQKITPKEMSDEINQVNKLIDWIKENCEISPHLRGFNIDRQIKQETKKALQSEFFDTSLIVKNENYILFTEDERFSQVSINELGVQRVWMQPILMALKNKGLIDENDYNKKLIKLGTTNIFHLSFNASILVDAARKSDWSLEFNYRNLTKRLGDDKVEIHSAIQVVTDFLFEIEDAPIMPERKLSFVTNILESLVINRNSLKAVKLLKQRVATKYKIINFSTENILQAIVTWEYTQRNRIQKFE